MLAVFWRRTVTPEEREIVNALICRIQEEKDPKRFTDLVAQLNKLLDQKRNRITPDTAEV
jgi:hypothetical protein